MNRLKERDFFSPTLNIGDNVLCFFVLVLILWILGKKSSDSCNIFVVVFSEEGNEIFKTTNAVEMCNLMQRRGIFPMDGHVHQEFSQCS